MNIKKSQVVRLAIGATLTIIPTLVYAATSKSLAEIISTTRSNIEPIATFLIIVSYIAGIAFMLTGILQFKAHKDNPQQTPLSKPIIYIVVGALLLFLPTLIATAGTSIFGDTGGNSKSGLINTLPDS